MMDKEKILETVRGGLLGFVVVVVPGLGPRFLGL
jgi:hypothetical protein